MTGWISDWLRDIVLIILLATFVDLLIPNNALQRYVKVVVSLIILLTVLSPVIALLKADFTPESALRQAAAQPDAQTGAQPLPELDAILRDGELMRQEREQQALELVAAEIERHAAAETERLYPVRVVAAEVRLAGRGGDEQPRVAAISLVLAQAGEPEEEPRRERGGDAAEVIAVEAVGAVAPVDIAVPRRGQPAASAGAADSAGERQDDEGDPQRSQLARSVTRFLAEYWEVAEQKVQVAWQS